MRPVRGKLIAIWSTKNLLPAGIQSSCILPSVSITLIASTLSITCCIPLLLPSHLHHPQNLCTPRLRNEFVYALREVIERAATQLLQLDRNSISPIVMTNSRDVDLLICHIPMPQSLFRRKEIL